MKKLILLLIPITGILLSLSCSSSKNENIEETSLTQATITLKNSDGTLAQNQIIFLHVFPFNQNGEYNYYSDTEYGDARTNELGIAIFENLEQYPMAFEEGNSQVFGFDAYGDSNSNKKLEVTFKKGDSKQFEMILNN